MLGRARSTGTSARHCRDARDVGYPHPVEAEPVHIDLTLELVLHDRIVVVRIRRGHTMPFARASFTARRFSATAFTGETLARIVMRAAAPRGRG